MRNLMLLLTLLSLPAICSAIDREKLALTMDVNINWNTSGFNDSYRLYTFRKDMNGTRRQRRQLITYGIAYQHVTEGDILIQPSLSFGGYSLNKERQFGLASNLFIAKNLQKVKPYLSLSAFQSFGKGQNSFLKTINLGLIYSHDHGAKGLPVHSADFGIGLSLMHVDGSFIPGINFKINALGLWNGKSS